MSVPGFDEEGFNRNIDLLRQIAEKSKAAVGKWDSPLPGEKSKVRVDRNGTKLTKAVVERRRAKRMGLRGFGFVKKDGKWVKPNPTGGTEAPS